MAGLIHVVESPEEIKAAARQLRDRARQRTFTPLQVIDILDRWGAALSGAVLSAIPGVAFLRLWLRRATLEPIFVRELGASALQGEWGDEGGARLRAFPLGIVGHWPAGNIDIQPLLSLSCSLLAGNAGLVRVPAGLVDGGRGDVGQLEAGHGL